MVVRVDNKSINICSLSHIFLSLNMLVLELIINILMVLPLLDQAFWVEEVEVVIVIDMVQGLYEQVISF